MIYHLAVLLLSFYASLIGAVPNVAVKGSDLVNNGTSTRFQIIGLA